MGYLVILKRDVQGGGVVLDILVQHCVRDYAISKQETINFLHGSVNSLFRGGVRDSPILSRQRVKWEQNSSEILRIYLSSKLVYFITQFIFFIILSRTPIKRLIVIISFEKSFRAFLFFLTIRYINVAKVSYTDHDQSMSL